MLANRGAGGGVSEFIDHTVQRALFFETIRDIKRQNAGVDANELNRLIDEAVKAARANSGKAVRHANGA